jgi:hypothetical protein
MLSCGNRFDSLPTASLAVRPAPAESAECDSRRRLVSIGASYQDNRLNTEQPSDRALSRIRLGTVSVECSSEPTLSL